MCVCDREVERDRESKHTYKGTDRHKHTNTCTNTDTWCLLERTSVRVSEAVLCHMCRSMATASSCRSVSVDRLSIRSSRIPGRAPASHAHLQRGKGMREGEKREREGVCVLGGGGGCMVGDGQRGRKEEERGQWWRLSFA